MYMSPIERWVSQLESRVEYLEKQNKLLMDHVEYLEKQNKLLMDHQQSLSECLQQTLDCLGKLTSVVGDQKVTIPKFTIFGDN